jgi:7-keto-8-aminopelargonate synthetase-like enzyme
MSRACGECQRFIVDSSAITDVALRTPVASMLSAAMAPAVAAAAIRRTESLRERNNLRFYAELAAEHDAAKSFPAPTALPRISSRPANPVAEWIAHGNVENVAFASSFEAVNPTLRKHGGR